MRKSSFGDIQSAFSEREEAYAGFWLRLVAYWIDTTIWAVLVTIVFIFGGLAIFTAGFSLSQMSGAGIAEKLATPGASLGLVAAILLTPIAAHILYHALFETLLGGSIGKLLLALRVSTLNGERIGFSQSLGRNLIKNIPFLTPVLIILLLSGSQAQGGYPLLALVVVLVLIGSLLFYLIDPLAAAFTSDKQALHDRFAGTLVWKNLDVHPARRPFIVMVTLVLAFGGQLYSLMSGQSDRPARSWRRDISLPESRTLSVPVPSTRATTPPVVFPTFTVQESTPVPLTRPLSWFAEGTLRRGEQSIAMPFSVAEYRPRARKLTVLWFNQEPDPAAVSAALQAAAEQPLARFGVRAALSLQVKPLANRCSALSFSDFSLSLHLSQSARPMVHAAAMSSPIADMISIRSCELSKDGWIHVSSANKGPVTWQIETAAKLRVRD